MKKIILISFFASVLYGCASPVYNAQSTISKVSKPPIDSINTVSVGDKMLVQGTLRESEALVISETAKVSAYTIPVGQYAKTGENEQGKYFSPISVSGVPIRQNPFVDPFKVIMTTPENKLCVVTVFNGKVCRDNENFSIKNITTANEDSFQQTLIYSGKVGNKINIGYREFSSNIARPAFNNDVEYDLGESKKIGYKGALLEILNATNQDITYKVIANFNKE